MTIKLKPLEGFKEEWIPARGSAGAAAWDLYCAEDTMLKAYIPTLVRTKFEIEVPAGYGLLVLPRSGNAIKKGFIIPNSPGLIDEDYRGEPMGIFTWLPHPQQLIGRHEEPFFMLKYGDKMAQLLLIKYEEQTWEVVSELSDTGRGRGGFGSTDASPKS